MSSHSHSHSHSPDELHELIREHALKAVEFDRRNEFESAYFHYTVSIMGKMAQMSKHEINFTN